MEIRTQYGGGTDDCYGSGTDVSQELSTMFSLYFSGEYLYFQPPCKTYRFVWNNGRN